MKKNNANIETTKLGNKVQTDKKKQPVHKKNISEKACFSAALGASESHTWKIASPGQSVSVARFPFGLPRSGVRGKAYHNHRETSSIFLQKSLRIFRTPALTCTKSSVLERKIIFALFCAFCTKRRKGGFFYKGKLNIEQNPPKNAPPLRSTRPHAPGARPGQG